eukprot:5162606-Prymnesium_polylepis.1
MPMREAMLSDKAACTCGGIAGYSVKRDARRSRRHRAQLLRVGVVVDSHRVGVCLGIRVEQ